MRPSRPFVSVVWLAFCALGLLGARTPAGAEPAPLLRLWPADTFTKITPDSAPPERPATEVSLSLARGEHEGFQIAVRTPKDAALKNARVEVGPLVNGPHAIPAENVTWRLVGYVLQGKRRVPDMLLPVERFDGNPDTTYAVYVSVHAPSDAAAGRYRGEIKALADGQGTTVFPLNVEIYDFVLPPGPGRCRTLFALQGERRKWAPGEFRKYADFLLDHRLNPDDIYRHRPPDVADLEHYYSRGMNAFTIKKVAKGWGHDAIRTFLADLGKSKVGAELRAMAWFYGYDEKPEKDWESMGQCFEALEQEFPDIGRMTTAHVYMKWDDPVAVMKKYHLTAVAPWVHPGYPVYYRHEEGEAVRASGLQLWAYNINF